MGSLISWCVDVVLALAVLAGLTWLLTRAARAVALSFRPMSGELTDAAVYHRNFLNLQSADVQIIWVLLACGAIGAALARDGSPAWLWLSVVAMVGALGWELWTWERAAASTRMVTWQRGFRRSTRQVPISRIGELHLVERRGPAWLGPLAGRLGQCYIALQLREGSVAKLPRTGMLGGRSQVEDVANHIRLQMAGVEEERTRRRNDKRREAIAGLSPVDVAIRMRLRALRASAEGSPTGETNEAAAASADEGLPPPRSA